MIDQDIITTGEVTCKVFNQGSLSLKDRVWNRILEGLFDAGIISKEQEFKMYKFGELTFEETKFNTICDAGFEALYKHLCNNFTNTGTINKIALGNGSATPSDTSIKLGNEIYRNNVASYSSVGKIQYITAFFETDEISGNFTEVGTFIDGNDNADSGALWTFLAGLNWNKDSNSTMTLSFKYTPRAK